MKNEALALGTASIMVTSPQSSIAALPIPIHIFMVDIVTTKSNRLLLQSRLKAMPKRPASLIYTYINYVISQL